MTSILPRSQKEELSYGQGNQSRQLLVRMNIFLFCIRQHCFGQPNVVTTYGSSYEEVPRRRISLRSPRCIILKCFSSPPFRNTSWSPFDEAMIASKVSPSWVTVSLLERKCMQLTSVDTSFERVVSFRCQQHGSSHCCYNYTKEVYGPHVSCTIPMRCIC